jgi:hypothetical protein
MQAGDVVLVRGDGRSLIDLSIMHTTHSSIAHCAIAVDAENVIEAVVPTVRQMSLHYLPEPRTIVISPPYASEQARDAAVAKAMSYVGGLYDVIGIAEMLMFELTTGANHDAIIALMQSWSRNPFVWCSELVSIALSAAGLILPVRSFVTTPADIALFLGHRESALVPEGMTNREWVSLTAPTYRLPQ